MGRFVKYFLLIIAIYLAIRTLIALFFYDLAPIPILVSEFNQGQINEYRVRVLVPAFFLTLIYFIYRFFSGKNPTSTMWPIYVSSICLLITHIVGFITFLPLTKDPIIMFLITLFIFFVARKAHHTRKNEIF